MRLPTFLRTLERMGEMGFMIVHRGKRAPHTFVWAFGVASGKPLCERVPHLNPVWALRYDPDSLVPPLALALALINPTVEMDHPIKAACTCRKVRFRLPRL